MKRRDFVKNTGLTAGGVFLMKNGLANTSPDQRLNIMKIAEKDSPNICKTCGTRYNRANYDPEKCPICLDDRQYVKEYGQQWVSYSDLANDRSTKFKKLEENILELSVTPDFGIGQRAHLIGTSEGNILWDCIPFIDEPSIAYIKQLGGLKAIAVSHPHYYSLMNEWAKAFDCPIYIHDKDREWVMDDRDHIIFWSGENKRLGKEGNLVHVGGHFPGSSVLHFTPKKGDASLFVGDSFYVSLDKKHLSVMYSYPNNIPLDKNTLFSTFKAIEEIKFQKIYGAFSWQNVLSGGRSLMKRSVQSYRQIYS